MRAQVQQVPRFFSDEVLHGLGRWLRAGGYDTVIAAGGLSDRALATRCAAEHRVLLTKDRDLAATVNDAAPVVLLPGGGIDEAARALRIALDIDWQHAPFTRCIVDNRPLEAASPHSVNQGRKGHGVWISAPLSCRLAAAVGTTRSGIRARPRK